MTVDGIPTSCLGGSSNCSFSFTDTVTPTVHSVSPTTGQGGASITIQGDGFGEDTSAISILIGSAPCQVDSSTSDTIVCVTSRHAAGSYRVQVHIAGVGRAVNMDATCFTYLLTLSSVTPDVGGVTGGYFINITGEGFPDFDPVPANATAERFSNLLEVEFDLDAGFLAGHFGDETFAMPWLRYGLGLPPDLEVLRGLNLCPEASSRLEYQLRNATRCLQTMYNAGGNYDSYGGGRGGDTGKEEEENCSSLCPLGDCEGWIFFHLVNLLPSHVTVGGSPCIIVESSVDHMTCIPTFSLLPLSASTRSVNITVHVFDEQATLANEFTVGVKYTPVVTSVSVEEGPVSGGTVLTLTVEGFTTSSSSSDDVDSIDVRIGSVRCEVSSVNATAVVCTTPPQHSSSPPVLVSTATEGIALLQSSLSNLEEVTSIDSLFPKFEYRLFAEMDRVPSGSLVGGTPVMIYPGGIFVEGRTRVYFGELDAEIVTLQSDRLVVLTPTSAVTKEIYLITIEMRGL